MNKFLLFFLAVFVLFSCKSPVDKLLMSNDVVLKEQKAQEYFENCDYTSASPLFKDLIQSLNSTSKVEKVYFYYSYCDYMLEDYLLAAYEFKKIINKFPRGKYTEQAQFLLADCYYKSTPKYNLDQEYNLQAVQEYQIFIEKYPESDKIQEANQRIDELFKKREKKSFENAKLYYSKEDYRSAVHSFKQVLIDFPDTKKDEELRFLSVEAAYLFAEQSIESKRAERYKEVEKLVQDYLKIYKDKESAKYLEEVYKYQKKAKEKALELAYSLPHYYINRKQFDDAIALWENLIKKEKSINKKAELTDYLMNAHYQQLKTVDAAFKLDAVKSFLAAYDEFSGKLDQGKILYWKEKKTYYDKELNGLPIKLAYDFLAAGDYKNSSQYFEDINDTISNKVSDRDKHFYYLLVAKNKYAKTLLEKEAKIEFDEIIQQVNTNESNWKGVKFEGKIQSLVSEVNQELAEYPLILITNSIKRKDYGTAVSRAERILDEQNAKKGQEEVVYLLLLSSLKKAKSVKKYERLPQFKLAKSKYDKYSSLVTDEKLRLKLDKIELKIKTGLTKYLNKG